MGKMPAVFRGLVGWIAIGLASCGLILWMLTSIDLPALWRVAITAQTRVVFFEGPALVLLVWFFRTLRWQMILRELGLKVPFGWLFLSNGSALGLGAITPAQSGELIKIAHLKTRYDIDLARISAGFGIERFCDLAVLASLTAFAAGGSVLRADIHLLVAFVVVCLVILFVAVTYLSGQRPPKMLRSFFLGVKELVRRPRLLFLLVVLTFASWLITSLLWQRMLFAVDIEVPILSAILLIGAVTLAVVMSFVPSGLIVSEVAIVALLSQRGLFAEQALAGALILRAITLQAAGLGLACWAGLRCLRGT